MLGSQTLESNQEVALRPRLHRCLMWIISLDELIELYNSCAPQSSLEI